MSNVKDTKEHHHKLLTVITYQQSHQRWKYFKLDLTEKISSILKWGHFLSNLETSVFQIYTYKPKSILIFRNGKYYQNNELPSEGHEDRWTNRWMDEHMTIN